MKKLFFYATYFRPLKRIKLIFFCPYIVTQLLQIDKVFFYTIGFISLKNCFVTVGVSK